MPRRMTRTRVHDGNICVVHDLEDGTLTVRLPGGIQVLLPQQGRDALAARVSRHKHFMGHALDSGPAHRLARAFRRASSVEVRRNSDDGVPVLELRRYHRVVTVDHDPRDTLRTLTWRHARPEETPRASIHARVNMKASDRRIDAQFIRDAGRKFTIGEILTHQHYPF